MGKPKSRGNKTGSVFYRKDRKCWLAQIVVGWKQPVKEDGKAVPIKKTLSGFKTKKEALTAVNDMLAAHKYARRTETKITLQQLYDMWRESYSARVGDSTMTCYESAYKHFASVHGKRLTEITARDLQECMDKCPAGKRTHQNMKVTAGLLWHYAIDAEYVDKDITRHLYIGKGESVQREPLTEAEVKTIYAAIGKERYADYIYCMCYLGFRPGEMLELTKDKLFCEVIDEKPIYYFIGGKKTEAGRNRIVVVPNQILPIILDRACVPGTDLLFPRYLFDKKTKKFLKFIPMTHEYFRKDVFKAIMKRLNIAEGKVPYSARHTYADKLKKASGNDKDKASLIGHSSYAFTQKKYQSSDLADLKAVIDSFE